MRRYLQAGIVGVFVAAGATACVEWAQIQAPLGYVLVAAAGLTAAAAVLRITESIGRVRVQYAGVKILELHDGRGWAVDVDGSQSICDSYDAAEVLFWKHVAGALVCQNKN